MTVKETWLQVVLFRLMAMERSGWAPAGKVLTAISGRADLEEGKVDSAMVLGRR